MHQEGNEKTVSAVLADDHPLLMDGFARSLVDYGISVLGQTKDPGEVLDLYAKLKPDVLVLDIRFGDAPKSISGHAQMSGLDVARQVLGKFHKANIVFLSQFDQPSMIQEAYKLGAKAFVTKECDASLLANVVMKASVGEKFFLPEVETILRDLAISGTRSPKEVLDKKELEVFKMIAEGLTNQEIADKLGVSLRTISATSQAIKEKVGAHRPAELIRLAYEFGILQL